MNNLDPEVAEKPDELIVYGGRGKAARNWACFHAIVRELRALGNDETLLVQSGKPVAVFRTHDEAPRVLIANSNLVGAWSDWSTFDRLEKAGLIMYGQMTAGSWIYIGSQGIVQGTFETFAAVANKHFGGDLAGKLVVTGGLGGMGGAQPLAITLNGAVCLAIEVDPRRIQRRVDTGYCDRISYSLDEAIGWCEVARQKKEAFSVGLVGNTAEVLPELVRRGLAIDVVTDQTSAHDPLIGYIPKGLTLEAADQLRKSDPSGYLERSMGSMAEHVEAMLALQRNGAIAFDYGNNLRKQALDGGCKDAFSIPGFVPEYIRLLFCEGKGPFRWVALSGNPADIRKTDELALKLFPDDPTLARWFRLARDKIQFQGLPSRICWLGYGDRARMGLAMNEMVRRGELDHAGHAHGDQDRDRRPERSGLREEHEKESGCLGAARDHAQAPTIVKSGRQVCWIADRIHLPPRLRRKVQTSVASVRSRSLPSTMRPSAMLRVTSIMLKRMATVA